MTSSRLPNGKTTTERWASFMRPRSLHDVRSRYEEDSCDRNSAEPESAPSSMNGASRNMEGDDETRNEVLSADENSCHAGRELERSGHSSSSKHPSNTVLNYEWQVQGDVSSNSVACSSVATPVVHGRRTSDAVDAVDPGSERTLPRHRNQRRLSDSIQNLTTRRGGCTAQVISRSANKPEAVRLNCLPPLPYSGHQPFEAVAWQRGPTITAHADASPPVGDCNTSTRPTSNSRPPSLSDLVTWNGLKDPARPTNWPLRERVTSTGLLLGLVFCAAYACSVLTSARVSLSEDFVTSQHIAVLASTLPLLGVAVGAPFWAFYSDVYGRKVPLLLSFATFTLFNIPPGLTEDLPTLLAFRFFLGIFGAGPLSIALPCIVDIWISASRGLALSIFNVTWVIGTIAATVSGGCLEMKATLGWRWTTLIVVGLGIPTGMAAAILHSESSDRILLQRKARTLRLTTNAWSLHSLGEKSGSDIQQHITTSMRVLVRPTFLLPTIHMSYAHGCLCRCSAGRTEVA